MPKIYCILVCDNNFLDNSIKELNNHKVNKENKEHFLGKVGLLSIDEKKELLKAGIDKLSQTQKSIIIGQLETLKTTIQTAKSAADITLMAFENATSMALSAVELWLSIDNASSLIDEAVVNQTIENTKASYKDTFYTKHQSYVSASAWQSYWNILEPTNA